MTGPSSIGTPRTAWFHAFNGIAGDMALGACLDAGADVDDVRSALEVLDVDDWKLRAEPVFRGGLAATHAVVEVGDTVNHRSAADVIALVEGADLPDRVRARASRVFARLAEVEAHRHRQPVDEVVLHEVGAVDAIVDVVGTCVALELLGVDRVTAGPVATGHGTVRSAHGTIPVPAPAVVELLVGAPTQQVDVPMELTTPTGAALLSALAESWGPLPAMTIRAGGYGAGTRDLDGHVNAVQLVIGDATSVATGGSQPLVELSANVDDATGETLAHAVSRLLEAGAADAWIVPVLMKKGRPGHVVSALVLPERATTVREVLAAETGSFGVRATQVDRWPAARRFESVEIDGLPVRVKVSPLRTKVEHDDAADVARRTGRPLREVVSLAEAAARRRGTTGPDRPPDEPA